MEKTFDELFPPDKRDWVGLCTRICGRANRLWFLFFDPYYTGIRLDPYFVAGEYDVLDNLMEYARELKPEAANIESLIEDTCRWLRQHNLIGHDFAMPLSDCMAQSKKIWRMRNNKRLSDEAIAFTKAQKKKEEK